MIIDRKFYYIKPNTSSSFYHDQYNPDYVEEMNQLVKEIDNRLSFSHKKLTEKMDCFTLRQQDSDSDLFKRVTQNLYYEGELKQSFKDCMRFTKNNNIAFALATSKSGRGRIEMYDMFDDYAYKPDTAKLIDATPHQKNALKVYDHWVTHPKFYFTINFFDYKHNLKYVQFRFVGMRKHDWETLEHQTHNLFPSFEQEKKQYNAAQGIDYEMFFQRNITTDIDRFTTARVHKYLPAELQQITLPIQL